MNLFKKVMTMAVEGSRDERRFTFVSGRVRYSVDTRSIMYFESELRRINLVTTEQKYVFYGSIGEMEKRMKVGYGGFIRPHESYLVNPDHVSRCTAHEMILTNGKSIHISATRRADVKRYYSELINC